MDLATCGLHVVHGSIKTGAKASESELKKLIKTMWKFVHDAPSRQGIFENISQSTDYPAKCCGCRWFENEKCAEKAESLIKECQKFVTHVSTLSKKNQQPDSKSKSFIVLNKMIHDLLTSAKLKFF